MRMQFYQCLIVVILPYFAIACDVDACKIGTSAGMAVGCSAAATTAGALTCGIGAAFTFGTSCLAGLAILAGIAGGCSLAGAGLSKGKEIIHIWSLSKVR